MRRGTSGTHSAAWLAALQAGYAALVTRELDDLAIAVDDHLPTAVYSPARGRDGWLDPAEVADDLVAIYNAQTAARVVEAITAPVPAATCRR